MLGASLSLSGSAHLYPTVRRVEGRGGGVLGASWSLSGSAHLYPTVRRVEGKG